MVKNYCSSYAVDMSQKNLKCIHFTDTPKREVGKYRLLCHLIVPFIVLNLERNFVNNLRTKNTISSEYFKF